MALRLIFSFVLVVSSVAHPALAGEDCSKAFQHFPTGQNKALQGAMRQFRDDLNYADEIVGQGQREAESIDVEELVEAHEHLRHAQKIAQMMVDKSHDKMMPPKIDSIPEEERDEFLQRYKETNRQFLQLVAAYADAIEDLVELKPEERDFTRAYELHFEVREFANWAHRKF